MNFALSEEELDNPQARDINNKSFWRKMSEILQVTLEMLEKAAREQGINLDILVHLDRLRRKTEELFSDARAFVRPGFD